MMRARVLTQNIEAINSQESTNSLESGSILFFPEYYFGAVSEELMSDAILHKSHKNISYDYQRDKLGAYNHNKLTSDAMLRQLMRGYAEFSLNLIKTSLPTYVPHLRWGRTSFRPAQISGRVSSKRKDDTRLHVDSFSATPVNGLRILRIFCNVNPQKEPRVWQVGESFAQVMERFAPQIRPYNKTVAKVLQWVKTTKTLRSPYDHYMLHLHDTMKGDDAYQNQVKKVQIDFPAQSTWIVFTDHVSHAALSGQYLLEQTFYLPVEQMANPALSPLHAWKQLRPEMCVE